MGRQMPEKVMSESSGQPEAMGEPPCGELTRKNGGAQLRYLCQRQNGQTGVLEIGVQAGLVAYWRLSGEERRAADGE